MSGKACQFNGERMVMLLRWSVQWRENGHVTEMNRNRESMIVREVVKLMEVEWSCYGGGQVEGEWSLQRWSQMEEEWSCYRGDHFNEGRMVILQRWPV